MKFMNYQDVPAEVPDVDGIKDLTIRWLVSDKDGAQNFAMRLFEVGPGGHSPYHQHEEEHEMFILEGEGIVKKEDGEIKFKAGDFFFIEPWVWHNFSNTGSGPLKFLCMLPYLKK